ncbi:hypothetical protein OHA27_03520 [Streptomyces sp. NBC_01619]|uniref:Uncharacterized protein n=1 Tax=Streptomyces pratisoli TaxID=3139917 RepID=A0ACC6QF77_9ACTN|nr:MULTISPECIES: hypothetical protein [unclassified Streptomyces]MCX4509385.1 hypothetical protein [Streptomyces sp. NBC_01619]
MSEARTDTTQARPQGAAANRAEPVGAAGKHRGGAAASEDTQSPAHGRHRRPTGGGH